MSLTIDLSPEMERRLYAEAAREGRAPEEFARGVLEERLAAAEQGPSKGLAALLRQWREEPPDLEEAEGYPTEIEPLRLREVRIDP
jgi:plasmid stability protein